MNCLALAAAIASLDDSNQVENGRRLNRETKAFTVGALDSLGYKSIPSQANFVMVDLKRPVLPVLAALKQRNVQVGQLLPTMPESLARHDWHATGDRSISRRVSRSHGLTSAVLGLTAISKLERIVA